MVLALDIGASNIRIAEVFGKKLKNKLVIQNPREKNKAIKAILSLISEYKKQPIGIGIAAFMNQEITICTPNWDFQGVNLPKIIKSKFRVRAYINNDANCAALAEKYFGYGKKYSDFALLTLGTGVGCGLILNNKLYTGARGAASESGHMIINGKHLEDVSSATATLKLAKNRGLKVIDTFELETLAKKGNRKAISVYNEVGKNLGTGMLNLAYILDPEAIILGGGFANVKFIYKEAIKILHEGDWANRKIPVMQAKLKDEAGLIGAALLAKHR